MDEISRFHSTNLGAWHKNNFKNILDKLFYLTGSACDYWDWIKTTEILIYLCD
jgi:hypothetical protein